MNEQRIALVAMILSILIGLLGCAPRVCVTPNPGPRAKGVRYYRPKPYLKVVPAEVQVGRDANEIQPSLVSISLEYLPDFAEEYAIDVRSGWGVADVSFKLEDGWNLTEISQDLDSQTDENVRAAGDLIRAVGSVVPTGKQVDEGDRNIEFKVPASDVPLGYYESVIGKGSDGRKRLYGFRYLGFLPYESCPTTLGGSVQACCGDPLMPLYGLTFEQGRMVFKQLPEIRASLVRPDTLPSADPTAGGELGYEQPEVQITSPGTFTDSPGNIVASESGRNAMAAELEVSLLGQLRQTFPETQRVAATWQRQGTTWQLLVDISTSSVLSQAPLQTAAKQMITEIADGSFLYQVIVEAN